MEDLININGTECRFEANFNALGKALKELGMDTLDGLVDISSLKPSTFPVLFSCCLNEGARLTGSDARYTADEVGCMPSAVITQMLSAFIRQSQPDTTQAEDSKKD